MSERDEFGRARDVESFCYKKITYLYGAKEEKRIWFGSVRNLLKDARAKVTILNIENI